MTPESFQLKKPTPNMQCSTQMPFFPEYSLTKLALTISSLGFLSPLLRSSYSFTLILSHFFFYVHLCVSKIVENV